MRRTRWEIVGLWCGAVAVGCSGGGSHDGPTVDEQTARRLVGAWDATFLLDRPLTVPTDSVRPLPVVGVLAFVEDRSGQRDLPRLAGTTHSVAYDLDFRPFGFDLRDRGMPPVSAARTSVRDSVDIVFGAGDSFFSLRAQGAFTGDSLAGTWSVESPRAGAGGRFSMHRRQIGP